MRRLFFIFAATFSLSGVAMAAEPTGEWRVANGDANIRIDDCDGSLWGIIAWEKEPGGIDNHNPNPAERARPTLGIPILISMRPTKPGLWEGEVYNAENGKTYNSRLTLTAPDVLRIEGCVFGGLICGGENWTRVKAPDVATNGAPPRTTPAQRPAGKPNQPPPAAATACSSIPDGAGAAHKGGLK
jgi:uncharacterized protein (DUF2147 family)